MHAAQKDVTAPATPAAAAPPTLDAWRVTRYGGPDRFAPVMDRSDPLAELPRAHRYVATGRKRGNVVVV